MRCAKGIFAKGILGCTGFSLLRWEKGSETPSCGGEKGLRLPRSLGRSMRNEGVSDPCPHRKRESQTLFSHRKRENPVHPKIPLAKIPLAQRIKKPLPLLLRRWCVELFVARPLGPCLTIGDNMNTYLIFTPDELFEVIPCVLCVRKRTSRGTHSELLDRNYLT